MQIHCINSNLRKNKKNFQSENMHTKIKAEITRDTTQEVNQCIIGQTKTKKYSPQSNVYGCPVPRFYRFMKNVGV